MKKSPLFAVLVIPPLLLAMVLAMALGSHTPAQRERRQLGAVGYCSPGAFGGDPSAPLDSSAAAGAWVTPLQGKYTIGSKYGLRKNPTGRGVEKHTGQDLRSFMGDTVVAAAGGTVQAVVDLGGRSYGLHVKLSHPGGVMTIYAHLSRATVSVGQQVSAGQPIGALGNSGRSTGPHLHYEIRVNNASTDPVPYMAARRAPLNGNPTAPGGRPVVAVPAAPVAAGVDRSGSLTQSQRDVAAAIINTGQQLGLPEQAWVIALATAMQESQLGDYPPSKRANHEGDAGIFQQRVIPRDGAYYGTLEQVLDPVWSATTFYQGVDTFMGHMPGLVDIKGWETMRVTQAAQKVQRSAFPEAYAKHEATARALVASLAGSTSCAAAGNPGGVEVELPANATAGQKVVAAAMRHLGVPYSWAGGDATGPTTGACCSPGGHSGSRTVGFDCSGLTLYAWAQVGVKLPRTARTQHAAVTPVPISQIRAGDLLFFSNDAHVGIADGKGGMIHAPRTGKTVEVVPNVMQNSHWRSVFGGAGRPTTSTS